MEEESFAISVRIEHRSMGRAKAARYHDLPREIRSKAAAVENLKGRIAKMRAKEELTEANVRTLATYERRLSEKLARMEERQQTLAEGARTVQAAQSARETALQEREEAVLLKEQEITAQVEGLNAAVEAVREGTATRGADSRPQVTDATHAALLRPVWRSIGPS